MLLSFLFFSIAEDALSLVNSTYHLPRGWEECAPDQVRVSWLGAHEGFCWRCSTQRAVHHPQNLPQTPTRHARKSSHTPICAHATHSRALPLTTHKQTNARTHTRTHETGRPLTDTAIQSLDLRLGLVYAVEDALDARELEPATFGNVLGEVLRVWLRLVGPGAGPTRELRRLEVGHG